MWPTVLNGQEAHVYQIQVKGQRSSAHVHAKTKSTKISRLSEVVVTGKGIRSDRWKGVSDRMILTLITVAWLLSVGCLKTLKWDAGLRYHGWRIPCSSRRHSHYKKLPVVHRWAGPTIQSVCLCSIGINMSPMCWRSFWSQEESWL